MEQPLLLPAPAGPPLRELAAAVAEARRPVLLDTQGPPGRFAAWSYLAFDPDEVLERCAGDGPGTAFDALQSALQARWPGVAPAGGEGGGVDAPDARPAFRGGAIGWLAYDLGRELERLPSRAAPDVDLPDLALGLYPFVLAEQAGTGRRWVTGRGSEAAARAFLAEVAALAARARPLPAPARAGPVTSTFDRAGYEVAVRAVREHILDGDVYQVNLSQRLLADYPGDAAPLQAALAARFPAPFGALLRAPGHALLSASPELFLRRRGEQVLSRPIKGTRPRGADPAADAALRAELESSDKERAELAMIVDLVRNDLGRTARIGSVRVAGPFATDAWSTLFHRVAEVRCEVDAGTPSARLVAAAFPPASVTGTPKIRACEVIEELEPVRRHAFTGALGWIGADGDLDLSVAIRIATLVGARLRFSVGGGITLASEPAAEYDETITKARALLDVLGAPAGVSA